MLEAKTKFSVCEKDFPSFYFLQKHKKSRHFKLSRIQDFTADLQQVKSNYHDQALRKELKACQQFLVDSEFVRCRQHFFNFASTNFTSSFLKGKLQHVFENLYCAAKVNLAL